MQDPNKKKIDDNPVAILLNFLNGQQVLVANPPPDMTIPEIVDTKVLIQAIEKFIIEFNAAVYEVQTLRETLKLYDMTKKNSGIIL
jgi:hypothetical protein